jgi:hypothetical protein
VSTVGSSCEIFAVLVKVSPFGNGMTVAVPVAVAVFVGVAVGTSVGVDVPDVPQLEPAAELLLARLLSNPG